jgi:hypothetical protein
MSEIFHMSFDISHLSLKPTARIPRCKWADSPLAFKAGITTSEMTTEKCQMRYGKSAFLIQRQSHYSSLMTHDSSLMTHDSSLFHQAEASPPFLTLRRSYVVLSILS